MCVMCSSMVAEPGVSGMRVCFSPLSVPAVSLPRAHSLVDLHLAVESLFCQALGHSPGYLHLYGCYLVVSVGKGEGFPTPSFPEINVFNCLNSPIR